MNIKNNKQFVSKEDKVKHFYYHKNLSIDEIATKLQMSTRTVYRYLNKPKSERPSSHQSENVKNRKPRIYSENIRNEIISLKRENPKRSAASDKIIPNKPNGKAVGRSTSLSQ